MPAVSQAQRAYLNSQFGHAWVKAHHFDNRGKLPAHVKPKKGKKSMAKKASGGSHLAAPTMGHAASSGHVGPMSANVVGSHHRHGKPHRPFKSTVGKSGGVGKGVKSSKYC